MSMLAEILIVVSLILLNGVFSGAEIAIVSLRPTRVQQLLDEKRRWAESLARLRAEPERFLATVQVGITVIGTAAAAFGGSTLGGHLAPMLASVSWIGAEHAEEVALA